MEFDGLAGNARTEEFSRRDGSLADKRACSQKEPLSLPRRGNSSGEAIAMNGKLLWGLVLCLAGPLCAGCSTAPGVVRGQSPSNAPNASAISASSVEGAAADPSCRNGACSQCGGTDAACGNHCLPQHEYFYHYTGPDKGCCLENSCLAGCCCLHNGCCALAPYSDYLPDCLTNRGPLVYPTNPSPGALIQYPYYCCKGPDDFFWPPIGQANR